jgi:hypothetical protein
LKLGIYVDLLARSSKETRPSLHFLIGFSGGMEASNMQRQFHLSAAKRGARPTVLTGELVVRDPAPD